MNPYTEQLAAGTRNIKGNMPEKLREILSQEKTIESGRDLLSETSTGNSIALEFSIVMPCLNEAETLDVCIEKAQRSLKQQNIAGEVIIADNGSTDGSQAIASSMGARVVQVATKGYGSALMGGILAARGKYIIMGDTDGSHDFSDLTPFIQQLRGGYDLVVGNRFKGGIRPGAMSPLHRYVGNPVLTGIARLFFWHPPCGDFHCGLRGFSKAALLRMDLQTAGMEFASEMIVKAALSGMRITEVPTVMAPARRSRPPHLRPWCDGWRHLRFLLLYSPRWLFLYPGILLMVAGCTLGSWWFVRPMVIGGVTSDVRTLLYANLSITIGFQSVLFAVFTKTFAATERLLPEDPRLDTLFRYVPLELGLTVGGLLFAGGLSASVYALSASWHGSFGALESLESLRIVIPAMTCITLGFQIVLSSFFLSVLGLRRRRPSSV